MGPYSRQSSAFTSQFPFAADAAYTPADAPKETLFELHRFLGIERGVVVQSAAHGFDNSASADLIAAKPSAYVGVALAPVTIPFKEIQSLGLDIKLQKRDALSYGS